MSGYKEACELQNCSSCSMQSQRCASAQLMEGDEGSRMNMPFQSPGTHTTRRRNSSELIPHDTFSQRAKDLHAPEQPVHQSILFYSSPKHLCLPTPVLDCPQLHPEVLNGRSHRRSMTANRSLIARKNILVLFSEKSGSFRLGAPEPDPTPEGQHGIVKLKQTLRSDAAAQ